MWAWDLRGGHARPLYELSTGNMTVTSLVWHDGSCSLVAACESAREDRHGGCSREAFRRVRGSGGGDGSAAASGGSEVLWWPQRVKHHPDDFSKHLSITSSCVLRYRFSAAAKGAVPRSMEPNFNDDYY